MFAEPITPVGRLRRLYSRYRYHTTPLRWRLAEARHNAWMWFVWKLPRTLIYFAVIRMWAHGTTGEWGNTHPDELTWNEALQRWKKQ